MKGITKGSPGKMFLSKHHSESTEGYGSINKSILITDISDSQTQKQIKSVLKNKDIAKGNLPTNYARLLREEFMTRSVDRITKLKPIVQESPLSLKQKVYLTH